MKNLYIIFYRNEIINNMEIISMIEYVLMIIDIIKMFLKIFFCDIIFDNKIEAVK